jgi:CBS domain-containing protein
MTTTDLGAIRALADATISALPARPHVHVDVGATMGEVVDRMQRGRRGAILVESDGALVGIFTERDLLNRIDHGDAGWAGVPVRDVMTPYPMVIRLEDSLAEALRRLLEGRRRHLPILDERGAVLGMISIRDILSYIASRFPEELVNLPPAPDHSGG